MAVAEPGHRPAFTRLWPSRAAWWARTGVPAGMSKKEPDVTSDPNLDDPGEKPESEVDEGTSSDWTSEGGATHEGPATHTGPGGDE